MAGPQTAMDIKTIAIMPAHSIRTIWLDPAMDNSCEYPMSMQLFMPSHTCLFLLATALLFKGLSPTEKGIVTGLNGWQCTMDTAQPTGRASEVQEACTSVCETLLVHARMRREQGNDLEQRGLAEKRRPLDLASRRGDLQSEGS